jgi:L-fuculose-phosphate aldolase
MTLLQQYEPQVAAFVGVCAKLAQKGYVTSFGGNLAWKLEEDLILITPTRMYKGDVTPQDVVFIDLEGNTVEGTRRPTGERPMYIKFFTERPDIASVIHCHSPYVGAMAILEGVNWLMRPLYPETTIEIGPVPIVPYAEPLTEQLAQNFVPFLKRYNAFIMENHGVVMMTRQDIEWTMMLVEQLEVTAQSIVAALQVGPVRELSRQDVINLSNVMVTRELPLFGAPGVHRSLEELYFGPP